MKGFFISVQVLIIKIGIFIKPKAEAKCSPTTGFIHHDLAALEFWLLGLHQATASPDGRSLFISAAPVVRPENRTRGLKLRCVEQKLRVYHGHVICIQQEHLAKSAMEHSIRLKLPAMKDASRELSAHF